MGIAAFAQRREGLPCRVEFAFAAQREGEAIDILARTQDGLVLQQTAEVGDGLGGRAAGGAQLGAHDAVLERIGDEPRRQVDHAVLHVGDALGGERVRLQVGGRPLELVHPVGAQQALEEGHHRTRRVPRALEKGESHAVGLALVFARVLDLALRLQRSHGGDRRFGDLSGLAAAAPGGEDGEREGGERGELRSALLVERASLVALQDVADFVAHHARQLRFVLGEQDGGRVHPDVAAHEGEGVDGVVLHHEEIDVAAGSVGGGEQARAQRRDVVGDLGVVDVVLVDAHLAHDAVADRALLGVGQRRRRGVTQVRKALGIGRGPVTDEEQ